MLCVTVSMDYQLIMKISGSCDSSVLM